MRDSTSSDHSKNEDRSSPLKAALVLGDERAFKELLDIYQSKLFFYINKIVKSKEVSEELVLDIFLKIWNAKEMLSDVENLDTFLYRVAVNKALDFLKAAAREKKLREALIQQYNVTTSAPADHQYIDQQYQEQLRMRILQLPQQQQVIFKLSRDEGLSHARIANDLNLSKHTVKNHMAAALRKLRGILKSVLFFF